MKKRQTNGRPFASIRLQACVNLALFVVVPSYADNSPGRPLTTGENNLLRDRYLPADIPVAGQARFLHNVNKLQLRQPRDGKGRLTGDGIVVGVWDGGLIQSSHVDFADDQVVYRDPAYQPDKTSAATRPAISNHATHVAGTIAGHGHGRNEAAGMANGTVLWSFDFNADIEEMLEVSKLESPMQVSNHSYGATVGWYSSCTERRGDQAMVKWVWAAADENLEDPLFGKYTSKSAQVDQIALDNPVWTQVVAAGNSRDPLLNPYRAGDIVASNELYSALVSTVMTFNGDHYVATEGDPCKTRKRATLLRKGNNDKDGGYDTLPGGHATAKNAITVGAMIDPPADEAIDPTTGNYRPIAREFIRTTTFSSWGPTDDGRIKPDVIANGQALISTAAPQHCNETPCTPSSVAGDNRNYVQKSGTSMAAPVVTGTLALLNELSSRHRGRMLRSDEAKAILIHTAKTKHEGPNYRSGWGAIQADEAGFMIMPITDGESLQLIDVERGATTDIVLDRITGRPARVTLVWLDEPGTPAAAGPSNGAKALVNDIDIELIPHQPSELGSVMPWRLDPANVLANATRDINDTDNVERIDVPAARDNQKKWILRIRGKEWPTETKIRAALCLWGLTTVESS